MSVATTPAVPRTGGAAVLARPAARGARLALRSQLPIWALFWLTLVAVAAVILVITLRFGDVEQSVWNYVSAAPRWFAFTMLVLLVTAGVGPYVANGLTRRAFVALVAVDAGVTAVVFAACWTLGHAVETAVFRAQGWPTVVEDHLYADGSRLGLVALEALPTLLVFGLSGALVGAAYYRAGGWWGTLALPLTLAPIVVTEALLTGGWIGDAVDDLGVTLPLAVRALAVLVLAGGTLAALHPLLGRAAIRRPGS